MTMNNDAMSAASSLRLGRLGQLAVHVSDIERAEKFYREVLGLKPLFQFGELAFFDCDGVRLMLEGGHDATAKREDFCIYFKVEGIDATVAGLRTRGVYFEREPHLIARMPDHELWMVFLHDPDGNPLALMEERRQHAGPGARL